MATIAIGDIHGNFLALDELLKKVEGVLAPTDTVIFLVMTSTGARVLVSASLGSSA